VNVGALAAADVPDTLPGNAIRVLPGYEVDWSGAALGKPAALSMLLPDDVSALEGVFALYFGAADGTWLRLGGTVETGILATPIMRSGRYALFVDHGGPASGGTLTQVVVTPRVFSAAGSFAAEEAAISFNLGRAASVTVKIHNRAGRLMREVAAGRPMSAGANVVRWDGRDGDGRLAADGVYVVTIEALGRRETQTLALVR
jgi:hypothetical protein